MPPNTLERRRGVNEIILKVRRSFYIPLDATQNTCRQWLLNVLLWSTTIIAALVLLVNVVSDMLGMGGDRSELIRMHIVCVGVLASNGLVFALSRFSSRLARWLFVFAMFLAAVLSDSPRQVASGNNLIALAVPVVLASALIYPYMGVVVACLGGAVIVVTVQSLSMPVPTLSIAMLFLVALIAALLIHALERTLDNWRTANRNLALLNQASQALSSTLDMDKVLITILDEVRRLMGVVASSVWLVDAEMGELVCQQATEPHSEIVRGWRLAQGEGLTGWVASTGESLIVPDVRTDARHFKHVDQSTGLPIRSIISVPLRIREDVIGVLQVVDENVDRFGPADLELLEPLAATAAIAIENARLYAEEQHRAAELARALEQQRELDRLKDEFIQNISHELRTPLALILGHADLMNSGELGELDPKQQESVSVIFRRVHMLTKMVNDIIAIMTVEAQELNEEPVDLVLLVQSMAADYSFAVEEAELSLAVEVAPDLPPASGDPDQLRRMVDNLLNNALKFTPAGGHLTVRLWCEGNGNAKNIVLEVSDTGIGIPPEQLDRIFDRFYQVDGSSKRRYGGVGLGLALVKAIVKAHKGRVTVWSVVDEGSTFRVTLPAMNNS
jgi:signal transduction histidine kinase